MNALVEARQQAAAPPRCRPAGPLVRIPELPEASGVGPITWHLQSGPDTMAVLRGTHPDTFRRDDERYKAAFGLLTL